MNFLNSFVIEKNIKKSDVKNCNNYAKTNDAIFIFNKYRNKATV